MVEYILDIDRFNEKMLSRQTDEMKQTIGQKTLELLVLSQEDIKKGSDINKDNFAKIMVSAEHCLVKLGYDKVEFKFDKTKSYHTLKEFSYKIN